MPGDPPADFERRKADHIDLCATGDVGFREVTNLFEAVSLVHDALPEMRVSDVDLGVEFAGRRLRAPVVIAAMTGGVDRAEAINRDLASVAEDLGVGFSFGSLRPLLAHGVRAGYRVRDVAPSALVLGNIGVVQAAATPTAALERLVVETGADALSVHLNPAMEVVQQGGDDDFRGGLAAIGRLVRELPVPVVVKETGCGLSRGVGRRLVDQGVRWVDVGGAGGTSWVGVEALRAEGGRGELGHAFWDWGIPTAASVAQLADLGLGICATGGMTGGLMVAKAIALGACCGGFARPLLQAWTRGGRIAVRAAVERIVAEIRAAVLLSGARVPADLMALPVVLDPPLSRWVPPGTSLARRALP